jgi:hypothetical protein
MNTSFFRGEAPLSLSTRSPRAKSDPLCGSERYWNLPKSDVISRGERCCLHVIVMESRIVQSFPGGFSFQNQNQMKLLSVLLISEKSS